MEGATDFTVQEMIDNLGLTPLPHGGYGRAMGEVVEGQPTSAYRLITAEAPLDWRPVEAEELWTVYMGAPLEIEAATEAGVLRAAIEAGSGGWTHVPPESWLRTRSLGEWTLAGRVGLAESDGAAALAGARPARPPI